LHDLKLHGVFTSLSARWSLFLLAEISLAFKNFRCQGRAEVALEEKTDEKMWKRLKPVGERVHFSLENENFEWLHNEKARRNKRRRHFVPVWVFEMIGAATVPTM